MGKGLPRSMQRGAAATQEIIKQTLRFDGDTITVDGATGVGFGTLAKFALPEGNILVLGAVADLQFTGPTSADLADDWEGDFGVGSTPASDATISGADVDIIPSTAIAAATAEVSPQTVGRSTASLGGGIIDNTAADKEINLNLLIDDVDIGADGIDLTVTGFLHIAYIVLGDD